MTGARQIDVVSLDVDGTLYSIRRMVLRHLATIYPVRKFFRTLHRVRDEMRGQGPFDDFRAEQAARMGRALGISAEKAAARVEDIIDRRWMGVFDRVRPFTGVIDTLRSLSDMGIRLAVLSDYPVWPKLGGLGLVHLPFAAVVNTEQVGALKPHPAPFEHLARILDTSPGRVLHVGDIERCDIDGALAAGMKAARFYEGRKRPRTRAAFAFRNWHLFIQLLRFKGLV